MSDRLPASLSQRCVPLPARLMSVDALQSTLQHVHVSTLVAAHVARPKSRGSPRIVLSDYVLQWALAVGQTAYPPLQQSLPAWAVCGPPVISKERAASAGVSGTGGVRRNDPVVSSDWQHTSAQELEDATPVAKVAAICATVSGSTRPPLTTTAEVSRDNSVAAEKARPARHVFGEPDKDKKPRPADSTETDRPVLSSGSNVWRVKSALP